MSEKENKGVNGAAASSTEQTPPFHLQQQYYGTFQGIPSYNQPPPQPVVGFPQPAPPPGTAPACYYAHGYQTIPVYVVAEGRPLREPRLPCCGIGIGWLLFISGFFLAAIPWYVGALILLCVRVEYREKPGLVACMVASVLAVIAVVFGVTKGTDSW